MGLIFLYAFVSRIWGIDKYPTGFTQDEASFGYDAYSLLKTGKDQWGVGWPLVLRSFGDYKLPLYSYLVIPSVAVFGLNELATRLPNALFGFLAVIATYLMVLEMTKNKNIALLSSLFLALSPWHTSLSRGAFEANLTTFFMVSGVWAFLKGLNKNNWMILSSLFFGLNIFSYHSARFLTPLIFFFLILFFFKKGNTPKIFLDFANKYKISSLIFLFFLLLALGTMFFGGGKRGTDILITNPTDKWSSVSDRRYEAVLRNLPDEYSRIFNNKLTYSVNLFYKNYISYLSPVFLFTQGAGEWTYGMIPGRGVLYLFEIFTLIAALISIIKGRSFNGMQFILIWIFISPIPAAITKGPGYAANRVAVMMPAIQILSAYGLFMICEYLNKFIKIKNIRVYFYSLLALILFTSSISFWEDYIYHAPIHAAKDMHSGVKEIMEKTFEEDDKYKEIRVSRSLSVPQIWVAFYSKWDPVDYQKESKNWIEYQKKGLLYIDQMENYRLGNYSFGSIDLNNFKERKDLLMVGRTDEFPHDINFIEASYYPEGSFSYKVVDSQTLR